jgi:Rhodopirellula transposase DDE domain
VTDEHVEKVITATLEQEPPGGDTHWSTRSMARSAGMSQSAVSRIWRAFGLKPHIIQTWKLSTDPQFIDKVRDVVGLYMAPPENALVLCVDEKSQIRARCPAGSPSWRPGRSLRVRRPGGGRKRAADLDPGLRPALLALVEPDVRGDPMSPLRWTAKSLRVLAAELARQGHRASADTVADLLHEEGFSLQGNAKTLEGRQDPDRDAQFRYINEQVKDHLDSTDPVVSVDTKKKELAGEYKNGGREWHPEGAPPEVGTHDFPDPELGKAIPYGVYDVAANAGWVNVGTDHDTAAFAVESLRRWQQAQGQASYPRARRLLVTADAGGSNGYRTRAWKAELATFALEAGLAVTVCHFPPGTQCRCLCAAKQFMVTVRWCSRWNRHASVGRFVRSCAAGGGGPVGDPGACRRGA